MSILWGEIRGVRSGGEEAVSFLLGNIPFRFQGLLDRILEEIKILNLPQLRISDYSIQQSIEVFILS